MAINRIKFGKTVVRGREEEKLSGEPVEARWKEAAGWPQREPVPSLNSSSRSESRDKVSNEPDTGTLGQSERNSITDEVGKLFLELRWLSSARTSLSPFFAQAEKLAISLGKCGNSFAPTKRRFGSRSMAGVLLQDIGMYRSNHGIGETMAMLRRGRNARARAAGWLAAGQLVPYWYQSVRRTAP